MFNIKKNIIVFVVIMSSLMTHNALIAADFTFNVPVNFTKLHQNITNIDVSCTVHNVNNIQLKAGSKAKPVINGSIDTTVKVTINMANKNDVTKWRCETRVCSGLNCKFLSATTIDTRYKLAPGANNINNRYGSL